MERKTTLLDHMREVLRLTHLSFRTEEASLGWLRRVLLFHDKRHPKERGAQEIRAVLTHLAVHGTVAASTQHSALNAVLLLSRHVRKQPLPDLDACERATRPHRLPTVFTREEVTAVLAQCSGTSRLLGSVLYMGRGCVSWHVCVCGSKRSILPLITSPGAMGKAVRTV